MQFITSLSLRSKDPFSLLQLKSSELFRVQKINFFILILGLYQQLNSQMQSKKTHKVRVNALFHRLQINKSIRFQTRLLWKRHQNKTETPLINHEHGFSVFEENLTLEFNLVYDESKGLYEDKNTQIVAVISYEGRVKSGGYAKYNIAQVINNQLEGQLVKIPLSQCPDPQANVEVTFSYSLEEEGFGQVVSVLNASSRDLNMSRIDFHDDKISLQMDRINATISKLDELAHSIKNKEKTTLQKMPQLVKRVHELQGEKATLQRTAKKLQEKLEEAQREDKERAKNDQRTITDLEKQLSKKSKQFKSRQFIEIDEEKKIKGDLSRKGEEIEKYKQLLSQKQRQLKSKDISTQKEFSSLRDENNTLKNDLAGMSFKLARLFNAAYDYGDAKLLDYLQAAIGLTEQ